MRLTASACASLSSSSVTNVSAVLLDALSHEIVSPCAGIAASKVTSVGVAAVAAVAPYTGPWMPLLPSVIPSVLLCICS